MVSATLAALVLIHAAPAWHHESVARDRGALEATLTYERRSSGLDTEVRSIALRLVLHGRVAFDHSLAGRGSNVPPELELADVWGNDDPEAIVKLQICGNRCGEILDVVFATTGRVLTRYFGNSGWRVVGHDFESADARFFCYFASCAATTLPVQVLRIDAGGFHFDDITPAYPDLLRRDARQQWNTYLEERKYPYTGLYGYPEWFGAFVPYCADEYRLGVRAHCDRVLPAGIQKQLSAWGYR